MEPSMNPSEPAYQYRARLIRAIDGDTFEMDVDLGFKVHDHIVLRLKGFYAPELSEPGGLDARFAAEGVLLNATNIIVITSKTKAGSDIMSFSRYVADIYVDGELLALKLLRQGHVKAETL
jgi:micrococcal nuclease